MNWRMARVVAPGIYQYLSNYEEEEFSSLQVHEEDCKRIKVGSLLVVYEDGFIEEASASISRSFEEIL